MDDILENVAVGRYNKMSSCNLLNVCVFVCFVFGLPLLLSDL